MYLEEVGMYDGFKELLINSEALGFLLFGSLWKKCLGGNKE